MFRRAAYAVVLAAVLAATGASGTTSAPAAGKAECDWATEFDTTLAELGEQRSDWHIVEINEANWAQTLVNERQVEFSPDVPCRIVPDIVLHEWMHLQQARVYGSRARADAAYGDPQVWELVADCGAKLLGAEMLPYLDYTGWYCDTWALAEARVLIDPESDIDG